MSSTSTPIRDTCVYDTKECVHPESNNTKAGTKPMRSVLAITSASTNASATITTNIFPCAWTGAGVGAITIAWAPSATHCTA